MSTQFKIPGIGLAFLIPLIFCLNLTAQEAEQTDNGDISDGATTEEVVIVTAQRLNEDIQDVPIAVSALSAEMLADQQVITPSDIQINTPSVSYTSTNFGNSNFSIRGIGRIVLGRAETGVSLHVNEIPIDLNMITHEFFDMERVEVLRGPQGTLFGRNATGGVVNFVTAQPEFDRTGGQMQIETGSYSHERIKGMFNVGLGPNLALRVAGYTLRRDGFTENLAVHERDANGDPIPNIDDSIDGRNIEAFRATVRWQPSDNLDAWFMWGEFDEDDDRARISNMVCERHDLPTTGCKPDGFGFDTPHLGASLAGVFASGVAALPLGPSGATGSLYKYPRPELTNLRQVHSDFDPIYKYWERLQAFGIEYMWSDYMLKLTGAASQTENASLQDYSMDVGPTLHASVFNPSGLWPVASPGGTHGEDWLPGSRCYLPGGKAGEINGCFLEGIDESLYFSYDQLASRTESLVMEVSIRSDLQGSFNFLAGAIVADRRGSSDYYVMSNALELVTRYGAPLVGVPPLYPGLFTNATSPTSPAQRASASVFGEAYLDVGSGTKLTIGLRGTNDQIAIADTTVIFDAMNHVPVLLFSIYDTLHTLIAGLSGVPKELLPQQIAIAQAIASGLLDANHLTNINAGSGVFWSRTPNLLMGPLAPGPVESELAMYYGITADEIAAASRTGAYSAARVALSNRVPLVPGFGEVRTLTGTPSESEFTKFTGRLVFDHQLDDVTLLYGGYSRGYKPGGLNSAIPADISSVESHTFEPEVVNSVEFGVKTKLLDGRVTLNTAAFMYDYIGLQSTRIIFNSNIIENIDARIMGIEFEGSFQPAFMHQLSFDFGYSYLNTSVEGTQSLDPLNRIGGQDDWILLNNVDPGLTAINYIARESQISQLVVESALANLAAFDVRNGRTTTSVSYPENAHGVSIPALFSRAFLAAAGVETRDGNPVDLDGNALPYSPEHSLSIGMAYTQQIGLLSGFLTYRLDYYVQSQSYTREFNTKGDEIDGWNQVNAQLIFESGDGRIGARFWIRNVTDKNNVTGHYVTSDTSGFFRNYFLTEPRIMGISLQYRFGE